MTWKARFACRSLDPLSSPRHMVMQGELVPSLSTGPSPLSASNLPSLRNAQMWTWTPCKQLLLGYL